MKGWAYSCLIASLIGSAANLIGLEKISPGIAKTLRFIASMILVIIVFSPVLKFLSGKTESISLPRSFSPSSQSAVTEMKEDEITAGWILKAMAQKSIEQMAKAAEAEFPDASFALEGEMDEALTLRKVVVSAESAETARKIAQFIEEKYEMDTEGRTKEK